MEKSPPGAPSSALVSASTTTSTSTSASYSIKTARDMSTLAIPPPLPLPAFRREPHWDSIRSASSLPRLDTRNALPSIRELVPEHLLNSQPQERSTSSGPKTTLLTSPATAAPGLQTSPGYTHAPQGQKRRRLSAEDIRETERARQVPRLYHPSEASSSYPPRRESPPAAASAPTSSRLDGYFSDSQARPVSSGKYGTPGEPSERPELRHPVPSLTPSSRPYERDGHSPYRPDGPPDAYHSRGPPPPPAHARATSTEQPPPSSSPYRSEYGYSSFQPSNRYGSTPSSASTYERTPFTAPPYAMQYGEYSRFGSEMGPGGLVGETKQRKRRGNLPKETTDKLRAWFVAHLQHPYPTEDEKQELMRQTGLQMNQISNWFINARRRQLPNMINDARAESEAMSGRSLGSKTDLGRYERGSRDHLNLSDGEGRQYDDDLRLRRAQAQSRESI